jgi:cytochrome c-type biogenesis protein
MIDSLNVGIAFIAGLVSFFSPCVVVLVPIFLANLAGVNLKEADLPEKQRLIRQATWLFVIGFTITFTIFGSVSGLLAQQFVQFERYFTLVAGILIIFFGLVIADIVKLGFLMRTFRLPVKATAQRSTLYPLLMGIAFAAGWTPCVGPILAAILLLAGESGSATVGAFYLLIYSIGLTLPFLLVGYFIARAQKIIHALSAHLGWIKYVTAAIVILLGLLLLTGNLGRLLSFFYFLRPPTM